MASIRIAAPGSAAKGEVIEIKALIRHPMESGYRRDGRGKAIARDIITRFACLYGGEEVFAADFGPGIAADPFLTFYLRATATGTLTFRWTDQNGESWSETADLTVT